MDSRSKNSMRNVVAATISKLVATLLPFLTRTLIIHYIGELYLGLNGLFTSLLMILNLSELGIGSALVFCMYKPAAENDEKQLKALLNLYKKIYRAIGAVLLFVGLLLTPLIPALIKGEYPQDVNIYVVYLIFLFNSAISYFAYAHKKALLTAYQRNDILSYIETAVNILVYGVQILILIFWPNYYLYILVYPIMTMVDNIWVGYLTKKRYPSLYCEGEVSKEEKKEIKKYVYGIALQKLCSTARTSSSNIIISVFLGLFSVAVFGNYYYIMIALHTFFYQIPMAIRSSVGNSVVSESINKNYSDFKSLMMAYSFLTGWSAMCLFCLYQPFMHLWMGEKMMLPISSVILLALYYVVLQLTDIFELYKDAAGLWWFGRYRVILETISNLVLSSIGGYFWGINGVIIGIILSILFFGHGYGCFIVYKNYFRDNKYFDYLKGFVTYVFVIVIIAVITYGICLLIDLSPLMSLFTRLGICIIVALPLLFLSFRLTNGYKEAIIFLRNIYRSVR